MLIETYSRKPLLVEAVQMTEENAQELREWCGAELYVARNGKQTLQIKVLHPARPDQTKAQAGDWVLKSSQGYKIYADSAFQKGFELYKVSGPRSDDPGERLRTQLAAVNKYDLEKEPVVPVATTDALQFKVPNAMDTI